MNLFRKALEDCRESGDMIFFRPANKYVPRAWVEKMAEHEWECEETGTCSHPSTRSVGCYEGQEVRGCWICDALLKDGGVLNIPVAEIVKNLEASK